MTNEQSPDTKARACSTPPSVAADASAGSRHSGGSAYVVVLDALRANGRTVRERGSTAQAQCPVAGHGQGNGDRNPSLTITHRSDGKGVLVKCHAGCEYTDVLDAVGLLPRDLYDDPVMRKARDPRAEWRYPGGGVKKRIPKPGGDKMCVWKGKSGKHLYLADKIPDDCPLVLLTEGESGADLVWGQGSVAVATGGAEMVCDVEPLRGRVVWAVVDRDSAGLKWAATYSRLLAGVAASVKWVRTPLDIPNGDVGDHIDNGLTVMQLEEFDPFTTTHGTEKVAEEPEGADTEPALIPFVLSRSALRDLPAPQPLIDNVLDQGTVALLYGMWGTWKSFIALDWAASLATGRPWQGRATEKTRVLYVAGEGAFGIAGRVDAWEVGWGRDIADGAFDVLQRGVNLTNYREVNDLAALISWGGYGFVVLDTLARCMVGADENSAKDCGEIVDVLGRLRDATPNGRGVILPVHHTGKDGKTWRGSSAFEAGADTVYSTARDGGVVVLDREKRKDGPKEDSHRLTLDPIEGTGSCVISLHRGVEKPERARALLSTFLHHFSTTGATKAELRKVSELSEGTYYRALDDLVRCGDLVNHGTEKRPFYKGRGE